MFKNLRKGKQVKQTEEVVQEEVTFEAIPVQETEVQTPVVPAEPEVDESTLSPEERRLLQAKRELEAVQAEEEQNRADELAMQDIQDAQRRLESAQQRASQIKSEKDFRFKSAQQKLQEAQADIETAKAQKVVWEEVSNTLKNFQASPAGQGIPDETALVLGMMMGIIGSGEHNWLNINNSQYFTVAIRDWMRSMTEIAPKIATYHAYRKRIGLE